MLSIPSASIWWAKAKIYLPAKDLGQRLRRAIRAEDRKEINRILSSQATSELTRAMGYCSKRGHTALHTAAAVGDHILVERLIHQFHANPNAVANNGRTPLHKAVLHQHIEVVRVLLFSAHANYRIGDTEGNHTPIELAEHHNDREILEIFNAYRQAVDLRLAIQEFKSMDDIHQLVYQGADIQATDSDGNSPLHLAIINKRALVMRYLIQVGAEIHQPNKNKLTPRELALMSGSATVQNIFTSTIASLQAGESSSDDRSQRRLSEMMNGGRSMSWILA